ncbi:MAG TPA: MFS transporter [Candidatus Acidoferrum sp.]|nr:MFS transporter [Candidatus Acidoferrum sp.]
MTLAATRSARWPRLMAVVFITYSLAYLDRVNYGFGAAGGLGKSLGITPALAALLGATFFLGYFLFQIPGGHYAESRSAKRLIFWGLILWGAFASATGLITSLPLLFADRFALGVVESMVLPGLIVFLSHWFTRAERSRANTFLILGNPLTVLWASVVSGYLIASLGWRWMFVLEGIPAIVWAFCWWRLVEDDPREARWVPEVERRALEAQLAAEQRDLPRIASIGEALRRPAVIVLALQYLCWSLGVYGFVLWLPSILKDATGLGIATVGWLSAAPYLLAAVAMLAISSYSDRTGERKWPVAASMFVGALAFYVSYALGPGHFALSYTALIVAGAAMYAPYGPFFAIVPELLPRNVAGAAVAFINSAGAVGGFAGSYLVGYLNGVTGSPSASYSLMAVALLLAGILTLTVRVSPRTTALPATSS